MLLINLPHKLTRRVILQQAYHHTINSALIACTHTVSYSISLPARGSFHLSITVLVHYRLLTVFSLSKMVLLDSYWISCAPHYSGATRIVLTFIYRAITVSGCAFQHYSISQNKFHVVVLQPHYKVVWAVPRSLAATKGITDLFYFLPVTKMFQFTDLPLSVLCVHTKVVRFNSHRVSPFGHSRIKASYQLPVTFRRLVRPSSAVNTKVSTIRA